MKLFNIIISLNFVLFMPFVLAGQQAEVSKVKLYTMDCGTLDVSDMSNLSNNGEYSGQKTTLVNPCFLIRHAKGNLLWDTGHIDSLADDPNGSVSGVWHSKLRIGLIEQLKQIGLSSSDIKYLSLSHIHPDHAGNSNKFAQSTFIVNKLEHEYMFTQQIKGYFGEFYSELESAKTVLFDNTYDVFGDNSVVIHSMPGHTPGSSVLLIRLTNSGNILLSGDLFIHAKGRELNTMHKYNFDKKLTHSSRQKFESLVKEEKARVIIQHEKLDFDSLPKFPSFID